jgi:dsRNA-specific ribonuclease
MTEIRAALINSNMLGYICMAHGTSREVIDIKTVTPKNFQKIPRVQTMQLWRYMRYESEDLRIAQEACNARYDSHCGRLQQQMKDGYSYPWITLADLRPEGFYSDLIKSVIGAIYVDSKEDLNACKSFVDAIGISSYMQRLVRPDYSIAHPRSVLQQLAPTAKVRSQLDSDGCFSCKVSVNEVEIAAAEGCKSKIEASILASHKAVQTLVVERALDDVGDQFSLGCLHLS